MVSVLVRPDAGLRAPTEKFLTSAVQGLPRGHPQREREGARVSYRLFQQSLLELNVHLLQGVPVNRLDARHTLCPLRRDTIGPLFRPRRLAAARCPLGASAGLPRGCGREGSSAVVLAADGSEGFRAGAFLLAVREVQGPSALSSAAALPRSGPALPALNGATGDLPAADSMRALRKMLVSSRVSAHDNEWRQTNPRSAPAAETQSPVLLCLCASSTHLLISMVLPETSAFRGPVDGRQQLSTPALRSGHAQCA